jgi:hypothetical protein
MAAMPAAMIRRPLLELTVFMANYSYILNGGYVDGFRVVIAITVDRFRSLDKICCSYAFSYCRCPSVRFGSLAAPEPHSSPTAAFGRIAVVQDDITRMSALGCIAAIERPIGGHRKNQRIAGLSVSL